MSLTVHKLNDDTTFLLAFAPSFAPQKHARRKFPGAFTILVDPWLNGSSSILHPRFQISHHTSPTALKSLADLEELPDLILVSQDKPDHCHRETLCSLPPDTNIRILATPAAAKKIRAWNHFNSSAIHIMRPYDANSVDNVTRIRLAPYTSSSSAGEITIANIPTKRDVTGLHNAIGITYRAPGSLLTAVEGDIVHLSDMITPTATSTLRKSKSAVRIGDMTTTSPFSSPTRPRTASSPRPIFLDPLGRTQTESPPSTPDKSSESRSRSDSKVSNTVASRAHKEKTLSIIYTPHGVSYNTLATYVKTHLSRCGAVPITAMFHCVNTEENPWFMGGTVANGAPGGVRIAVGLDAKHWISAHDEVKDNRGMATTWIKSRRFKPEDVRSLLWKMDSKNKTSIHLLDVGETMRIDG